MAHISILFILTVLLGIQFYCHSIESSAEQFRQRFRRAALVDPDKLWPGALIPYQLSPSMTTSQRLLLKRAMDEWEKHTCITFIKRSNQTDYVQILGAGKCGCCSQVGRKGGQQFTVLSNYCASFGVMLHELGHTVGFWHEHSRLDRDNYVKVIKENIRKDTQDNFNKKPSYVINSLGQPYDYYSIMHYRKNTFSSNGKDTIVPRQEGVMIGQRKELSPGDIVQTRILYNCPNPKCDGDYENITGVISTPNFPINYYNDNQCTWTIPPIEAHILEVTFFHFEVEETVDCYNDYLEIRAGIKSASPLIGRLCGRGTAGILRSYVGLWFRFYSDESLNFKGIQATYKHTDLMLQEGSGALEGSGEPVPMIPPISSETAEYVGNCRLDLNSTKGWIESPLLPVEYDTPVECSWVIKPGEKAKRIKLEVISSASLEIECFGKLYGRHKQSEADKLEVDQEAEGFLQYRNHELHSRLSIPYSCWNSKLIFQTTELRIEWSSHKNKRFRLEYTVDFDECESGTSDCEHVCENTIEGYSCSCHNGYQLFKDGKQCQPKLLPIADKCNMTITTLRGKIIATTEPSSTCTTVVLLPTGYRVTIEFDKFQVNSTGLCSDNSIEIILGGQKYIGKFCNTKVPPQLTSRSGRANIIQHANLTGWHLPFYIATYYVYRDPPTGPCQYKVGTGKRIHSVNFPHAYDAVSHCKWRVTAPSHSRVQMIMDVLDIEHTKGCWFDFLEIRDGKYKDSPLIERLCGSPKTPFLIQASGRHMTIIFVTDATGSGKGFSAHFTNIRTRYITE